MYNPGRIPMTDTSQPLWPHEAHPRRDEALAYRQRIAERAFAQLKGASWRESAVSRACQFLEQAIDLQSTEQQVSSEPIVAALRAANLVPLADGTLTDAETQQSN